MSRVQLTELIESGAHFGHLTRRWNPKMKPFIFMEKNGIHIFDLKKTQEALESAAQAMTEIVSKGMRVLFVGTKKQAKHTIAAEAKRSDSNWVSERWLGGMLTNYSTIRKSIKRLQNVEKMESDGTFEKITKKECLILTREKDKLRKILDGVETMAKIPGALFVVDIKKEGIAVKEALRLNIPIFAIVDTNCDPDPIDYVIPANDDASRAIEIISKTIADAVIIGNEKSKELRAQEAAVKERDKKVSESESDGQDKKEGKGKVRRVRFNGKDEKRGDRRPRHDRRLRTAPKNAAKEVSDKTVPDQPKEEQKEENKGTESNN